MNHLPGLALILFAVLPTWAQPPTGAPSTGPRVEVVLPEPAALRYARPGADRAAILAELGLALERAVQPRVPTDGALRITILTVDMAGRYEPWHPPQLAGVRIVRDVYSPSIDLEFALADAAGVLRRQGRRILRDPSGALLGTRDLPADPLRFEKLLLRNWAEREFPADPR
jgi:hypothetical protein